MIYSVNNKLNRIEKNKKRENIIVKALKLHTDDQSKVKEGMENCIKTNLELEVSIITAQKLGEQIDLVQLENVKDKEKILGNKSKLRRLADSKK